MIEKQASLYFQQGSSDKEYHAQVVKEKKGYVVNFQYGRRGSNLKPGTKTPDAVTLQEAVTIWEKLVKSKIRKGYQEGEVKANFTTPVTEKKDSGIYPQLLNEVKDESHLNIILEDDEFVAQEKFDGERRLLKKEGDIIIGINKKGQEVPVVDAITKSMKFNAIIDCEIVGDNLHVFDILSLEGKSLKSLPYEERLEILEGLKFGKNIKVCKTYTGKRSKKSLLKKLQKDNKEGIVFKKANHKYKSGRPNSGGPVFKFKFYKTATVRVAGFTKGKRSVSMAMLDEGNETLVGKVTIPPNKEIPEYGSYVEVRYLYAYRDGCLYQPTYLGERNDQNESDINLEQLVYKAD